MSDLRPGEAGETFDEAVDGSRVARQRDRVWTVIADGQWRTLDEISASTGDPPASVSARLRDFRKERYGSHTIERRRRGAPERGLFEYRFQRPTEPEVLYDWESEQGALF